MDELEVYKRMNQIAEVPPFDLLTEGGNERARKINEHREWLKRIRHEKPSPAVHFRVAVYIRYFNQTRHENYLDYHIKQFQDTLSLCPNWTLVDFYVDEGSTAPRMESAPEWSRLLQDCFDGKVDLIITQKVSNVSRDPNEISLCARLLAAQTPPIGIYFISEDLFTLASYYMGDLRDMSFFPTDDWELLPDDPEELKALPDERQ